MPDADTPRVITYETIGSTNEEALARARNGERGPLWIVAKRQEAGRGRRGRQWFSEAGNLYASLLLSDPSPPDRAPELSFVAALAAHDAVTACAASLARHIRLKWPNDLLLDGAKVAGILVEAEAVGPALCTVTGIGINCRHHPNDTPYPATDLAAAGAVVSPDALFASLTAAMTRRLAQWDRGLGFSSIGADWRAHAAGIGEQIAVRAGEREVSGRFESIDDAGRLLLRLSDGRLQTITAGEVSSRASSFAGTER